MFQAITTKYIGPTNTRPGRIKAQAYAGSLTVEWDHALSVEKNHEAAAKAFANKMEWRGVWFSGGLPNNKGNVFVCVRAENPSDLRDHVAFGTEGRN